MCTGCGPDIMVTGLMALDAVQYVTLRVRAARASHAYDVEVARVDGDVTTLRVTAYTRASAASIARKAGYTVRSVNMIG